MDATTTVSPEAVIQGGTAKERLLSVLLLLVLLSNAPLMALMFTAVAPVLPGISTHFSAGDNDGAFIAQIVMTMPAVGVMVGGVTLGWVSDKVGPRWLLLASLLIFGASGLSGYILENIWLMFASRALLGLAASGVGTATMAMISVLYSGNARDRVLGYQGSMGSVVGVLSLLLAGAIGQHFGWRAPFLLYAFPMVILLVAVFVFSGAGSASPERASSTGSMQMLLSLWPSYLLVVAVFVAVFLNSVQVSFLLAAEGHVDSAIQSYVMGGAALANAVGAWSYGAIRSRLSGNRTFALSLAMMAFGYLLAGLSSQVGLTVVGVALAGLGSGIVAPHVYGLLLNKAPGTVRGRAVGLLYTATYAGDFLNPWIVRPLRAGLGIHGVFILFALAIALCVVYLLVRREHVKPLAA